VRSAYALIFSASILGFVKKRAVSRCPDDATLEYNPKSPWPEGEACVVPRPIALKATASMTRLISESWFFLSRAIGYVGREPHGNWLRSVRNCAQ